MEGKSNEIEGESGNSQVLHTDLQCCFELFENLWYHEKNGPSFPRPSVIFIHGFSAAVYARF
jgi:hypothetical protein